MKSTQQAARHAIACAHTGTLVAGSARVLEMLSPQAGTMRRGALILLLVVGSAASAQGSLIDLAHRPGVDKYVTINLANPKSPLIARDQPSTEQLNETLTSNDLFVVDGTHSITIMLAYINPLKNKWAARESAIEDPSYASAKKFVDAASTLLATVGAGSAPGSPGPPTNDAARGIKMTVAPGAPANRRGSRVVMSDAAAPPPNSPLKVDIPPLFSPDLSDWSLFAQAPEMKKCFKDSISLQNFVNALGAADNAFYIGDDSDDSKRRAARVFGTTLAGARDALLGANSMAELRLATARADTAVTTLGSMNTAAGSQRDAVKDKLKTPGWSDSASCKNFTNYTTGVVSRFVATTSDLLEKRKPVVSDLQSVLTDVERLIPSGTTADFVLTRVMVPDDSIRTVTLVVSHRQRGSDPQQVTFVETGADTLSIRLRTRQAFLFTFTSGLAYTMLRYSRFGTDTNAAGKTIVVSSPDDTQPTSAVALLSAVWDKPVASAFLPLVQVGLGTAQKYPLLLVGVGGLAPKVGFAFSIGCAINWTQKLEDLTPGVSTVSGTADIEQHLKWGISGRGSFYVSIQRGL